MECLCKMLPYPHPPQTHSFYQSQMQQPHVYAPYVQHQQSQHLDDYALAYGAAEYAEFGGYGQGAYYEDFDDVGGEVSTRPRLTKEQVEILESQFQANHKPSSTVKRQLAMQTMLSLPRVANWFQNRRAKAKQQKKQEEFENSQAQEAPKKSAPEPAQPPPKIETAPRVQASPLSTSTRPSSSPVSAASLEPDALRKSRLASYASVDRLRAQQPQPPMQNLTHAASTESLALPRTTIEQHQRSASTQARPAVPQWTQKPELMEPFSGAPQHFQDTSFDFGFGEQLASTGSGQEISLHSFNDESVYDAVTMQQEHWPQTVSQSQPIFHGQLDMHGDLHSPGLPSPAYHDSRRGSGTEALAANFGSFALATPVDEVDASLGDSDLPQPEAQLDLAARRKRPRPAALTSASLRSRSYGALTTVSPTVRSGFTPPTHAVRHVKSTGHSLNARFAGIRKPSSARQSPMNVSTFAEAETLQRLMAQQMNEHIPLSGVSSVGSTTPVAAGGLSINTHFPEDVNLQKGDLARSYQLAASQHLTLGTASPPGTPYRGGDFNPHAHFQAPPVSAPPQYATFADHTPPYSAGPLTNSSWPDAPLTSPDVCTFSSSYLSQLPTMQHTHDMGLHNTHHQQFILPSDTKPGFSMMETPADEKPTEFFIHQFPKQKEEHAHAAQQLAQGRPKNYVFANTAQSDYDQS